MQEAADILLQRGANKEHRNVSDYTPLSLAASGGFVSVVKLLLHHGAEINSRYLIRFCLYLIIVFCVSFDFFLIKFIFPKTK